MIEIISGSFKKPVVANDLKQYFKNKENLEGRLWFGYPVIGGIEGATTIDALFVSPAYGIFLFDLIEGNKIDDRSEIQDQLINHITARLLKKKELARRGKLKVEVNAITYAPACRTKVQEFEQENPYYSYAATREELDIFLEKNSKDCKGLYPLILSVIDAITSLGKGHKRREIKKKDSKGDKLRELEKSINHLDFQQEKAVIETSDSVQRIRGLAGSGKTIVLALKVAYLHSSNPNWDIAVTFKSRSLKQQFKDLITKFTIEQKGEEPDFNKISILNAWGGVSNPGIYYQFCTENGVQFYDFNSAKRLFYKDIPIPFDGICQKALDETSEMSELNTIYDVILIDEAQDFPDSFMKLCFSFLKVPKRLVYAYDELQKLNEESMSTPKDLFDFDLRNPEDGTRQDIILKKCYRNSRPILVTAHAMGFGVYREEGLVQFFDNPILWEEIGYDVVEGRLKPGYRVKLERPDKYSPKFLESHSDLDDIIQFRAFGDKQEQAQWIADQIKCNLSEDELQFGDIMVIHPNPRTTKSQVGIVRKILFENGISSHIAGHDTPADIFYYNRSIAFTQIHRAKGNEAPMVYIMDTQFCNNRDLSFGKRNILFTAISRSKAWIRVCGYGDAMKQLVKEFDRIKKNDFTLDFTYPTKEQMERINVIHREKTKDEKKKIKQVKQSFTDIMESIQSGEIQREDIKPFYMELNKMLGIKEYD